MNKMPLKVREVEKLLKENPKYESMREMLKYVPQSKEEMLEIALDTVLDAVKDFCLEMWKESFLEDNIKKEFTKQGRVDEIEPAIILAKYDHRTYIRGFYYLLKDMEMELFGSKRAKTSRVEA
jgi:hypothetical protein